LLTAAFPWGITIRNLDDSLKSRLRIQTAVHGRSMGDEARDILRSSLKQEPMHLGTAMNALFKLFGGFDLPQVPREPMRKLATFDE
jgi:plasmid stability protein